MHNIIITDVATIQEENEDKRVSVLDVSTKTKQIDGEVDIISSFRELRKINLTLKDDILK